MGNKYLGREDAPFGSEIWDVLDTTMKETATTHLVGRRLLPIEGPFGLGLKTVPLGDKEIESGLIASEVLPILFILEPFALGVRDLANYEREGVSLDTSPVTEAAIACAHQEDELVFNGAPNVPGLLTVEDSNSLDLSLWEEVGTAADDIIRAITALDDAGFPGPYCLALAPDRYNLLYRVYPTGRQSEMEHIQTMVTGGLFKTPILESGGVLLASSSQCASVVLGQDMTIGFVGPTGNMIEFNISESLTPRIRQPESICVLRD